MKNIRNNSEVYFNNMLKNICMEIQMNGEYQSKITALVSKIGTDTIMVRPYPNDIEDVSTFENNFIEDFVNNVFIDVKAVFYALSIHKDDGYYIKTTFRKGFSDKCEVKFYYVNQESSYIDEDGLFHQGDVSLKEVPNLP